MKPALPGGLVREGGLNRGAGRAQGWLTERSLAVLDRRFNGRWFSALRARPRRVERQVVSAFRALAGRNAAAIAVPEYGGVNAHHNKYQPKRDRARESAWTSHVIWPRNRECLRARRNRLHRPPVSAKSADIVLQVGEEPESPQTEPEVVISNPIANPDYGRGR